MRIAVPVSNDRTAETLSGIEGFQFFEDDHGRIVRRFFVPRAGEGAAAAVAQLEPYGVDALVCGALPGDERLDLFGRRGRPRPEQQMQRLRLSVLLLTERQGRLRQDLTQKSVPLPRNAFLPFSSGTAQAAGGHLDRRLGGKIV